jgi:N-acetylmuramoyl-L-alanine amidase
MIDPGHGGEDTGTFHSGIKEKDLVLKVAKLLQERVARDARFEVSLTRTVDQFIPLDDRSKLAEDKKVDLFLSIHANSSPDERARGTEVYFENQTPSDEESMLTAARENGLLKKKEPAEAAPKNDVDHILSDLGRSRHMEWSELYCQTLIDTLRKSLGTKGQSIRQAPFRVLGVPMPASLIELGFLTNPKDAAWLSDPKTHVKIADALYASLVAYKEKLDKLKRLPVD